MQLSLLLQIKIPMVGLRDLTPSKKAMLRPHGILKIGSSSNLPTACGEIEYAK